MENQGVTMEEVFKIISQMNAQNQENLIAAIAELKKPSDREQKKIDEEEKRIVAHQKSRMQIAQAEEQRKENLKRGCPHSTYHPGTGVRKHAWRAQVHTPANEKPFFQPICSQCLSLGPKILATSDQLQNGVNLDQYMDIDLSRLEAWAKATHEQVA